MVLALLFVDLISTLISPARLNSQNSKNCQCLSVRRVNSSSLNKRLIHPPLKRSALNPLMLDMLMGINISSDFQLSHWRESGAATYLTTVVRLLYALKWKDSTPPTMEEWLWRGWDLQKRLNWLPWLQKKTQYLHLWLPENPLCRLFVWHRKKCKLFVVSTIRKK